VKYLRRFHPTIPVRSVNETVVEMKQKTKAAKGQQAFYDRTQEINGIRDNGNVEPLRVLLNSLAQQWKKDSAMKIALIGYPNVGKSTLLNSLKRKALSTVSSYACTTKRSFEVQLNDKITLIDTPALDADYSDESAVILRHGIAASFIEDAVSVIQKLLERADAANLMQHLQIPMFKDHEDFLKKLALKRNLLRKGGDPDVLNSARTFLRNLGNCTYHTSCLPPTKSKSRFDMPEWYKSLNLEEVRRNAKEISCH
jgi:nuclear GTP-binding protein